MKLKFRAFNPVSKEMRFADIYDTDEISKWVTWKNPADSPSNTGIGFDVMQFTGLQDVNGVDIYAEDIVKFKSRMDSAIGIVKYDESKTRFVFNIGAIHKPDYRDVGHGWYGCKVIGNIHQNPELMEK